MLKDARDGSFYTFSASVLGGNMVDGLPRALNNITAGEIAARRTLHISGFLDLKISILATIFF